MRSLILLTVVAGAVAWGIVRHLPENEAAADPSTRAQEVVSVALDGRDLPIAELRAELATQVGAMLDTAKLDRDRSALEAALVARGFLDAKVQPAQVTFDEAGAAFVTFSIAPGPAFHVRSVTVTGATGRDTGVVTLAPGEVVLADRIEHCRAALATRLAVRGSQTTVAVKLVPDEAAATVDLELIAR